MKWGEVVMENLPVKFKLVAEKVDYLECKYCHRLLPMSKFALNGKNYINRKESYEKCSSCKKIDREEEQKKRIESMDAITLKAEMAYQSMKQRCGNRTKRTWYADVVICEEWMKNKQVFIKWFREHYYEIEGALMIVDKDLFGRNSRMYSPETACILPQNINAILSNLNRYRFLDKETGVRLPLAVYYDKHSNKYFSRIQYCGTNRAVQLSYHDTMEAAFEEYRFEKKQDIKRIADKYKNDLPARIYEALLRFEIKPY